MEPLVQERQREKNVKYQDLAADYAKVWQGYKVTVSYSHHVWRPGGDCYLEREQLMSNGMVDTREVSYRLHGGGLEGGPLFSGEDYQKTYDSHHPLLFFFEYAV